MNKIKNILENNKKKKLVVIVLLLLAIALSTGYILTNKKADVKPTSNKTSEVTTKEDNKSDKKTEVKTDKKSDEKKDEVKEDKKEDKKVETTVEETKTTNVENNTTSTPTENNTTTNTTSNTVSNTAKPTSTPCVPTYTTVNHPEQGHYETQVVQEAYDQPVYAERIVGLVTGRVYNSLDEFMEQEEDGNYTLKMVQVDTIHHEAVTQQVWIVDQQAWTETVASGC